MKSPKIDMKVFSPKDSLASPSSIASPPSAASTVDDSRSELMRSEEEQSKDTNNNGDQELDEFDLQAPKRPVITLKSRKMKGLKELLLAEKLNTNAISLQITAQSHIGKKSRGEETANDGARPKRSRRE